jgi:sulfotransferase
MNKTYHFLSGLPRSGNTLLSAILNQNPDIHSSAISPVPEIMWNLFDSITNSENVNISLDNQVRCQKFMSSVMDNFYKDIDKTTIIDREKMWGTPDNLYLIKKYITPIPKIIFTVRDILDIIASFVKMDADYIKRDMQNSSYYFPNYRSEKDAVVEYLMAVNGNIDKALLSLSSAFYPENKGMFYIVEYNDLVLKPEETMSGIYKFLELPEYEHNFNNIERVEVDNSEAVGLPKNIHDIRKSLSKSTTSSDILSDYIKHKYSNMEFWRKDSLIKVRGKDF